MPPTTPLSGAEKYHVANMFASTSTLMSQILAMHGSLSPAQSTRLMQRHFQVVRCEAKPTTLKRPSPGDGLENHMYCLYRKNVCIQRYSYHFESLCLLMVASLAWAALAFSRVQPVALATQALKDIPLWPLIILFVT